MPWLSEIELSRAIVPAGRFVGHRDTFVPPSVSAPVFEFHVVGVGVTDAPSLREVEERACQLARDMRSFGWVAEGDQLVLGAAGGFGWAVRPPATSSSGSFPERITVEQFRGAVVHSAGVCAFRSLDTDMIGALVDQQSLQTDLATLFGVLAAELPETESVTLAACLSRADRVGEGNPGLVGTRSGGRVAMSGPVELRAGGDFVVPTPQLTSSFGDLGADLAHAVVAQLRNGGRQWRERERVGGAARSERTLLATAAWKSFASCRSGPRSPTSPGNSMVRQLVKASSTLCRALRRRLRSAIAFVVFVVEDGIEGDFEMGGGRLISTSHDPPRRAPPDAFR